VCFQAENSRATADRVTDAGEIFVYQAKEAHNLLEFILIVVKYVTSCKVEI
jgi:hypothetical protein